MKTQEDCGRLSHTVHGVHSRGLDGSITRRIELSEVSDFFEVIHEVARRGGSGPVD